VTVKSTPFGGITLTGEDARAFSRQIRYGQPKRAAREAYERGRRLVEEYNRLGYAVIRPRTCGTGGHDV